MYKTDKIYLSPLLKEDSVTLFGWINQRDLVIFNASYKPIHEPNHIAWFENITNRQDVFIFGIRKTETDELIGSCQLNSINWVHRNAEMQARIAGQGNQGRGFGTDVYRFLLKFGFEDLNLHKLYGQVFMDNPRPIRVLEKLGFQMEGQLKQHVFIDGEYKDITEWGILRKDYERGKSESGNSPT